MGKGENAGNSIFSFSHNISYSINSLPNNKILDLSKLKTFADYNVKVFQRLNFVLEREENIVEKEKMVVTSIFSFSHNVY